MGPLAVTSRERSWKISSFSKVLTITRTRKANKAKQCLQELLYLPDHTIFHSFEARAKNHHV